MSLTLPLVTLLPIRDTRERTFAYELRTHPVADFPLDDIDSEARRTLTFLQRGELLRLVKGRTLHIPVTPAVVRGGAITGFASADVAFVLAADALDDPDTLRALERYASAGFQFVFLGATLPITLPTALQGSLVAFDTGAASGLVLTNIVQRLLDAGARPVARQVDDRATRERLRASGVVGFTGRALPRGRRTAADARPRAISALRMLTSLADGRPPGAEFDAFIASDTIVAQSVLRAATSAAVGTARPRTLTHAFSLLGREAMLDRLVVATAFLLGDCAGDAELPLIAIRRSHALERLGSALDRVGHPRARVVAGLLSVADVATGLPPAVLADELHAPPLLRDTVLARETSLGQLLDVVEAHEHAWWDDLFARCETVGLAPAVVGAAWTDGWQRARLESTARAVGES